ncbi:MAG: O-antigen ligase family protein [Bacteroidetes bacterium]|nr:O-antigen ligase family protein [Bacteroidota bacterium]
MIHELFWLALIPVAAIVIYIFFVTPNWILLLLSLLTPLSFSYNIERFDSAISIPTEPILMALTVFYILKLLVEGNINKKLLYHPISIAILFNLFWIMITSISSSIPLVSLKFLTARIWYVAIFYFMGVELFKEYKYLKLFIWLFSITLVVAVIYTLIRHSQHFFTQDWANKVTYPFFKDHTIYGAIIALFIPFMIGFFIAPKTFKLSSFERIFAGVFALILILGLIFSFTRAAWVSIMVSFVFMLVLFMRIKFSYLLIIAVLATGFVVTYWSTIQMRLVKTESVSSTDIKDHFESISNISTDVSNTERINRWMSAIRMFQERPFLGWGPGTFMFKYAPYQLDREKTAISTNFGTLGNAHSEYLGPLSESGLLGMLSFLVLVILIIAYGMKIFYHSENKQIKYLSLLILLSLITYLSHGIMNNFLHTDKASVPFWSFIGMLTVLDLYRIKIIQEDEKN